MIGPHSDAVFPFKPNGALPLDRIRAGTIRDITCQRSPRDDTRQTYEVVAIENIAFHVIQGSIGRDSQRRRTTREIAHDQRIVKGNRVLQQRIGIDRCSKDSGNRRIIIQGRATDTNFSIGILRQIGVVCPTQKLERQLHRRRFRDRRRNIGKVILVAPPLRRVKARVGISCQAS